MSSKLAWSWPTSASPNSLNHSLQVNLSTGTTMASKLARLRPPSSHDHGLHVYLQTGSIMIGECNTKFPRSWPPSVSPSAVYLHHQEHLQSCVIMAAECIWEFTSSACSGPHWIALTHHVPLAQMYRVTMGSNINRSMRIRTEYMSFKHCWTVCSRYNFQAHQQHSQRRCFSKTALLWLEVLPGLLSAL